MFFFTLLNNMVSTLSNIIFYILALVMVAAGILAVTSRKMLRAATWLLFVLIGTAGLYLLLNYHFLAAIQLSVYAGGILVLFIFAILLTRPVGDAPEKSDRRKVLSGLVALVAGIVLTGGIILKTDFLYSGNASIAGDAEISMHAIGTALMGTGRFQYLMAFEALSILLLICIIGGVLIARRRT
jgi:NADH-quinone oxidoreductase subunit J